MKAHSTATTVFTTVKCQIISDQMLLSETFILRHSPSSNHPGGWVRV